MTRFKLWARPAGHPALALIVTAALGGALASAQTSPTVLPDGTYAAPAGVERTGTARTMIQARFFDPDTQPASTFLVTFKLRLPDDTSELVLVQDAADGAAGVTITDQGGGNYLASVDWDPPDAQTIGFYDLFFSVADSSGTARDGFANNLDELEIHDAVSNSPPFISPGALKAVPDSVTRQGDDYALLKFAFQDTDIPGPGAFLVTISVQGPAGETVVVDNAADGTQGLVIRATGGSDYEASVLWNPGAGTVPGSYDLACSVTDDRGGTAVDGYADNPGELTVSADAPAGDGNLLHRSRGQDTCGGPNSACHNLSGHQNQGCLSCHTPHASRNIYLIRESIQTPNSGSKTVLFKTKGIGDPYNDPDPVAGDNTSGAMGDGSDGAYTNICEVCHTATSHHRNDASTPAPNHHDAEICTTCHSHEQGFPTAESDGNLACDTCHTEIYDSMKSGAPGFHHTLTSADPDYLRTNFTCLMCHVDHDIFRPDLNPGIGGRGRNLRSDSANTVVQGDATVLTNTDFTNSGNGGLCISCHEGNDCLACHAFKSGQAANFNHVWITRAGYAGASSTHNYTVASTFASDGSSFNANCVKCHGDNLASSYQNSPFTFGLHGTPFSEILSPLGQAGATDPLEETFCYRCHSTTSNPNAGANLDYYGVKPMSGAGPLLVEQDLGRVSTHPVGATSAVHVPGESSQNMPRHVECTDCHNPHETTSDRPPSPALPGALTGVDGIDQSGNFVESVTSSYQVCFKCHGDRHGAAPVVPRQINDMNTRLEFNPAAASFHPVVASGKNPDCPSLIPPYTETSIINCEDCHASSTGGSRGTHGSDFRPILKLRYETADNTPESAAAYALCYSCHDRSSILGDRSFGEHNKHIVREDSPCSICHDPHGINSAPNGDGSRLINFRTDVATADPKTGRFEFISNGNFKGSCYVSCHGKDHSPKSY